MNAEASIDTGPAVAASLDRSRKMADPTVFSIKSAVAVHNPTSRSNRSSTAVVEPSSSASVTFSVISSEQSGHFEASTAARMTLVTSAGSVMSDRWPALTFVM